MDIASRFMSLELPVRSGTLRLFGCWFGRPMDNYHVAQAAEWDGQRLRIAFNEGEVLEVWEPSGLEVDGSVLRIPHASRVRWSWFYYGRPRTAENLRFYDYQLVEGRLTLASNYSTPSGPSADAPAVELC